jgi:hypothetical protein
VSHTCPADGCAIVVTDHMLMCRPHWFALPRPLRDAIYDTYRRGQAAGTHPTRDYVANVQSARDYLRQAAGNAPAVADGVAMPAITIWQPWASLIAAGCKPFEFRSWQAPRTHHGKRIAIHAGARAASRNEVRDLILRLQSSAWRETGLVREPAIALLENALAALPAMPRKAVICTAQLGTPMRNGDMERALGLPVVNDSDRDQHTMWGWPLTDIRPLDPTIPASGSQGFFPVTVPRSHAEP